MRVCSDAAREIPLPRIWQSLWLWPVHGVHPMCSAWSLLTLWKSSDTIAGNAIDTAALRNSRGGSLFCTGFAATCGAKCISAISTIMHLNGVQNITSSHGRKKLRGASRCRSLSHCFQKAEIHRPGNPDQGMPLQWKYWRAFARGIKYESHHAKFLLLWGVHCDNSHLIVGVHC